MRKLNNLTLIAYLCFFISAILPLSFILFMWLIALSGDGMLVAGLFLMLGIPSLITLIITIPAAITLSIILNNPILLCLSAITFYVFIGIIYLYVINHFFLFFIILIIYALITSSAGIIWLYKNKSWLNH